MARKNTQETAADDGEGYDDILNRSWDELPIDKLLPDGTYILRARNANFQRGKEGKSSKVLFYFTVTEALDDVPQDALEALGADYDITENEVVKQSWVNGRGSRQKDWRDAIATLRALGAYDDTVPILSNLKNVAGKAIKARLGYRSYTNNQGQNVEQNEILDYAAIE